MNMAIEKMIGIIIFLVVLIALIFFLTIGIKPGSDIGSEVALRSCCEEFKANNCDTNKINIISCNEKGEKIADLLAKTTYQKEDLNTLCGCQ